MTAVENTERIKKRIGDYSRFAVAVLFLKQTIAGAEVIYTDLNPDIILSEHYDLYNLDLNSDEVYDFGFLNISQTVYTNHSELTFHLLLQRIWAVAFLSQNSFACISDTFAGYDRFYPYAFSNNQFINHDKNFNNNTYQRMAFRSYQYFWNGFSSELGFGNAGGNWYPEVLDHYLGVRFLDIDSNTHYGWIRCDIKDEGRTLVVKDFAYEVKPEIGIYAGDTIGDTTENIHESQLSGISVYCFNSELHIQLPNLHEHYKMRILNLNGTCVYSCDLKTISNVISLKTFACDVYAVEVMSANGRFTQKVFIN